MANPSVWKRHPDLFAFASSLRERGASYEEIAKAASERIGIDITANAIQCRLRRDGVSPNPEALAAPADGYAESARIPIKHEHPKGWEPHVEENGNTATAISQPLETANPDEEELIRGWNLDPKQWRIVGNVNCRRWQSVVAIRDDKGKTIDTKTVWLYYYKANLERVDPVRESQIADLIDEIRNHVPVPFAPQKGDDAVVAIWSDTQAGKSDGDGSPGLMRRALEAIDRFGGYVEHLRRKGAGYGPLYILGLGDLIENCEGHYPQQAFRADLNLRAQVNLVRRLILKSIEQWSPLFERVVVAAVAGNHGENRRDGKSFTDFADNHDLAIFDQIEDVLSFNRPAYGHVSFAIPKDQLALTLEMGGEVVGMTHGHITGSARAKLGAKIKETGSAAKKVLDWWAMQAHGQQPIGDARILFTGHYHHLLVTEAGRKTHVQVPAMDGGSDWWRNLSGQDARPGMLACRVGTNVSESGWGDLEVL